MNAVRYYFTRAINTFTLVTQILPAWLAFIVLPLCIDIIFRTGMYFSTSTGMSFGPYLLEGVLLVFPQWLAIMGFVFMQGRSIRKTMERGDPLEIEALCLD